MTHYSLTVCPFVAANFSPETLARLRLGDPNLGVFTFGLVDSVLDHWLAEQNPDGTFTVLGQIRQTLAEANDTGCFLVVLPSFEAERADFNLPTPTP